MRQMRELVAFRIHSAAASITSREPQQTRGEGTSKVMQPLFA